jgi:hypothetical protein
MENEFRIKAIIEKHIDLMVNEIGENYGELGTICQAAELYAQGKHRYWSQSSSNGMITDEVIEKEVKRLAKESTAPDKETPDWMKEDIRRGIKAGIELASNGVQPDVLNLAQAELRAMYKRLGINGSNVLDLIDNALSSFNEADEEGDKVQINEILRTTGNAQDRLIHQIDYWQKRCEAAEYLMSPDAAQLQPQFRQWQQLKNQTPEGEKGKTI